MRTNLKRQIVVCQLMGAFHSEAAREAFNKGWYNSAIDYQKRSQRAYKRARDLLGVE